MKTFDVGQFIKDVSIVRGENENCEFEVTKQAMDFYMNYYSIYENWDIRQTENAQKNRYGYVGSWELYHDGSVMTADILTELNSPFRKITNIKEMSYRGIILGNYKLEYFDKSIEPYVKAFAYVYYWIGNMLPVPQNPVRLGNRGTWRNKILYIKGERKNEANLNVWDTWIDGLKDAWIDGLQDGWIDALYLKDCFKKDMETVKPFYTGLEDVNQVYFSKKDGFDQKLWFVNNVKLIIQRSYRILNKLEKDFEKEDINNIIRVFENVFEKFNCNVEKLDELF